MAAEQPAVTSADPISVMGFSNGALKRHYPTDEVSYKECMRNHAAAIGGHALDGCCEFMPAPEYNISDAASLKCAACGCHRNFHRRDPDDPTPLHRHRPPPFVFSFSPACFPAPATGKKRVRTKFSEEQKEKMREFSGRFGWKVQKMEKGVIEDFCKEIGIGRDVLKVWLHNHKNKRSGGGGGDGGGGTHIVHHHHLASSGGDGSSSSSG